MYKMHCLNFTIICYRGTYNEKTFHINLLGMVSLIHAERRRGWKEQIKHCAQSQQCTKKKRMEYRAILPQRSIRCSYRDISLGYLPLSGWSGERDGPISRAPPAITTKQTWRIRNICTTYPIAMQRYTSGQ